MPTFLIVGAETILVGPCSSEEELIFLTISLGGELFLFGTDLTGFTLATDDPALDSDSVDDLLEPVAF